MAKEKGMSGQVPGKSYLGGSTPATPPQKGSPAGDKPAGMTGSNPPSARTGGQPMGTRGASTGGVQVRERPFHRSTPLARRDTTPNTDGQMPASPARVPNPSADSLPPQLPTRTNATVNRGGK